MEYQVNELNLALSQEGLKVIVPIITSLIGFIVFWFMWESESYKKKLIDKHGEDLGLARLVINTKIIGGISMGIFPLLTFLLFFPETKLSDLGFGLDSTRLVATGVWILALGLLVFFLIKNNAKKEENLKYYPQIRSKLWTRSIFRWNLFGWAFYLVGYEMLFRGVSLFALVDVIGIWPTIAINIVIYSATHIPKGLKETLGAIPLSIVLCLLCLSTGNIWIAVIVHIVMAWTNTTVAFKNHPEMTFKKL